jgi:hypothetical protein
MHIRSVIYQARTPVKHMGEGRRETDIIKISKNVTRDNI